MFVTLWSGFFVIIIVIALSGVPHKLFKNTTLLSAVKKHLFHQCSDMPDGLA